MTTTSSDSFRRLRLWVTLLSLVVVAIAGCDKTEPRGRISGRVTFQSQPVSEGRVVFSNGAKGIYMTAELQADGRYEVITAKGRGLPLETYQVSVVPPRQPVDVGSQAPPIKEYRNIPAKYRDSKTSGLTLTVQKDDNAFDIEMK